MALCCKVCYRRALDLTYGRCPKCYEEELATGGELPLITEAANNGTEVYEYTAPDTVFASFYRLEPCGDFYLVKTDERLWCLKIHYYEGFPCPPRLSFVSPYNHEDENPIWWPRLDVNCNPITRKIDTPYVAERTAIRGGLERGDLNQYLPKSQQLFLRDASSNDMTYKEYLNDFWEKKNRLENGTNAEAHAILNKWIPETYVHALAHRILP